MARTFITADYVSDEGHTYSRKCAGDLASQLDVATPKLGAVESTEWHPAMPRSYKPRVALAQDSGGVRYRIVAFTADALILIPGATLNIFDRDGGSAVAVTVYGSEGERKRNKMLTP